MMDCYEVASPEVLSEHFGEEVVALNLENGRYYSLRGLAQALWDDIRAGYSPAIIHDALCTVDVDLATASAAFMAALQREKLIRPRANGAAPAGPPSSVAAAQNGVDKPLLESFDDMADLIKADPIHEVDREFGWPPRREH
jgi:hypothetical protein